MPIKLLFICLMISILINFSNVTAKTKKLIPIKKPTLSNEEIINKISKNIQKPKKKPIKNVKIKEKKTTNEIKATKIKKLFFKIPKKKTNNIWFNCITKCQNI